MHPSVKANQLAVAAAVLLPLTAHAQSAEAASPTSTLSPLLVGAIAYLTRRMAIGGWLFYYYLQTYFTVLVVCIFLPTTLANIKLQEGIDPTTSTLYAVSYLLPILAKLAECVFASRLLAKSQRNARNLQLLRYVLVASLAANLVALVIDCVYFKPNSVLSGFGFTVSLLWCLYFFNALRVQAVFDSGGVPWNHDAFVAQKKSGRA